MRINKIKELCTKQGRTINELEREANLSPNSIYKWQFTTPAADKVLRVAQVLGTTVEYLLESET